MTDVVSFNQGDLFIARVFKYHEADPSFKWSNTYEFEALQQGDINDLQEACQALIEFEQAFHGNKVHFIKATMSTWVKDSKPYNPETFLEVDAAGAIGQVDMGATAYYLPLNVVLSLRRSVPTGRQGKAAYRGCLIESDVEWAVTGWNLTTKVTKEGLVSAGLLTSGVDQYLGGGGVLAMAMIGQPKGVETPQVRRVTGFHVYGVSTNQVDHAWYNVGGASS